MKVALTTKTLTPTGGMEVQMLQMSRELVRRHHTVDLLFNRDGDLRSEFVTFCRSMTEVPTFMFSRKRPVKDGLRLAPAVWAAVKARPDVLYVNNPDELAFGLLSGFLARSPVVCHLHGSMRTREMLMEGMITRLCARADRLIACSAHVRMQFVDAGIAPEKIDVIHNGIDLSRYPPATAAERSEARRALELPAEAFVALFIGRLSGEKGVETLLEGWRHLALPPERGLLLIVGSADPDKEPEARLAELQAMAPPGCRWLPARRDVLTAFHAADVVVVPSVHEAFGRVVVEGLAAGLPVVGSRVGGIPEILDGELSPFLFTQGSGSELADRLASLIEWRRKTPELSEECSRHVADRFGIDTMVDAVERVLDDVTQNH
jgi:glycosyltransferase involved in cell wall biosynthesis